MKTTQYSHLFITDNFEVFSTKSNKVLKLSPTQGGYMKLGTYDSSTKKQHTVYVHDLICTVYHGPRPEGHEVDHKDRNTKNNNPSNLHWVSKEQNKANRILPKKSPNLTKEQYDETIAQWKSGIYNSLEELAVWFNNAYNATSNFTRMSHIVTGRYYKKYQ